VNLVLGAGAAGFLAPTQVLPPLLSGNSTFVMAGELNGDGKPDLVATSSATGGVLIALGDGLGGFAAPVTYVVGAAMTIANPYRLALLDANGDGRVDIVGGPSRGDLQMFLLLNACSVGQSADLTLTHTGPATATAGDTISYAVEVTNNGPNPASGVVVNVALPVGVSLIAAPGCVSTSGLLTCTVGSLGVDAQASFSIAVNAFAAGQRTSHASVTSSQGDPNGTDNSSSVTTNVTAGAVTFTVTNANDSGAGSLRQAILDSNTNTGSTNTIAFNIQPAGAKSISLATALPGITNPVVIDGWTQGGAGYTGPPLVELNGQATPSGSGLSITAGGSTVRGLVINRFKSSGIVLAGAGGNTIQGNYVGTDAAGTGPAANTSLGIQVSSANNTIGGIGPGEGNLVSGNGGTGVLMSGAAATGNQVIGNRVGTNAAGTGAIPNGNAGVQVNGGSGNTIGAPGRATTPFTATTSARTWLARRASAMAAPASSSASRPTTRSPPT
jgi:uncharacterized repeat protein (TIGR01451 family)